MDKAEQIARGMRATELLENELYKEAFSNLKTALVTKITTTKAGDLASLDSWHKMYLAMEMVEGYLANIIADGQHAAHDLAWINEQSRIEQ